jgi:hypothetical protein
MIVTFADQDSFSCFSNDPRLFQVNKYDLHPMDTNIAAESLALVLRIMEDRPSDTGSETGNLN